jgi:tetratricopeptide (TPR) repeat protein
MKPSKCFIVIVIGLASLFFLQRRIDSSSPREVIDDETLYFASGKTIKRMSLGLDGLVADVYWIRTVQYFGRKVLAEGDPRSVKMALLANLLNIIVDLEPHHITAYRFGAVFLPDQDPKAAVDLLEKGIKENPDEWRLYQDLGFIYWHVRDYATASDVYERGSQIPGAPWWMRDLSGFLKVKGGSRETAREIYNRYLTSDDPNIRAQAIVRLNQIESLDELDAINQLLTRYKSETGRCPPNLRVLARWLAAMGVPLDNNLDPVDPDGYPYTFDSANCQAGKPRESSVGIEFQ